MHETKRVHRCRKAREVSRDLATPTFMTIDAGYFKTERLSVLEFVDQYGTRHRTGAYRNGMMELAAREAESLGFREVRVLRG